MVHETPHQEPGKPLEPFTIFRGFRVLPYCGQYTTSPRNAWSSLVSPHDSLNEFRSFYESLTKVYICDRTPRGRVVRHRRWNLSEAMNSLAHTYVFGPFLLDTRRRTLTKGRETTSLSEKLFQMLLLLLEADGKTVTRDEFISRMWPGCDISDANFRQHAFMLRELLRENGGRGSCILTVRRKGYRLAVSVDRKTGLVMKQLCERCQAMLDAGGAAMICSYECTYCVDCGNALSQLCEDCGGELVARPRRNAA